MIKTIELSRIKNITQLKNLVKKVQKNSDQYLFKENGNVVAALVSLADIEAIVQKDIEAAIQEVRQGEVARSALFAVMDQVQAKNLEFTEEEVEQDIMTVQQEIRHSHG